MPQHLIEVDADTAYRLDRRAAELGLSSSDVVAILARRDELDSVALEELERR